MRRVRRRARVERRGAATRLARWGLVQEVEVEVEAGRALGVRVVEGVAMLVGAAGGDLAALLR